MTVGELFQELELVLSDVCFSGLKNAPPVIMQKLGSIAEWMKELGMPGGEKKIGVFVSSLRAYQTGESTVQEAAGQFCALEFYCRNILGNLGFYG